MSPKRWRRIEDLYDAAVDLPPAERDRYLDEQCGAETELRRELAVMFEKAGGFTGIVEQAAAGAVDVDDPWTGHRLGPYRVVRLIGHGGMGAVYEGRREDGFEKRVAIKLVKYTFDSDFARRRFQQERQILARLDHANIARLLDGGDERSVPYLVMEFVEGRPLLEAAAGLSIPAKLRLFQKILAAVSYAHSELVVHRDIKPANVLVSQDGEPKLLDFGIARLTGEDASGTITMTAVMTPDYASPEQVKGEPAGVAADVYSLGATLFQMLSGARPHGLETYSTAEVYRAICEQEIRPPSVRAKDPSLARHLRGDLDTLVLHAMAKEPTARYRSAEAFRAEIDRYLEGRPLTVRRASARERAWKFVRRNRLAVTASIAVAASLIAGTTVSTIEARRAQRRFAQVRELANTFLFQFYDEVTPLPGSTKVRASIVETARKYLDGLAQEAGNDRDLILELAAAYERLGAVQSGPGLANLGQFEESRRSLRHAISLYERLRIDSRSPEDLRLKFSKALWSLGRVIYNNTQLDDASLEEAEAATRRSMDVVRDSASPPALRRRADAESSLGQMLLRGAKGREALVLFESAARRLLDLQRTGNSYDGITEDINITEDRIGKAEISFGDLDAALSRGEKVLQSTAAACNENAPTPPCRNLAARCESMGDLYAAKDRPNLGQPLKGAEFYERAIRIYEALGVQDPNDRQSRYSLSSEYGKLGDALSASDPHRALTLYGRSLESSRALVSQQQLHTLHNAYLGAITYPMLELGRFADARKAFDESLGSDPWSTPQSPYTDKLGDLPFHFVEARILWGEKRPEEARVALRRTIDLIQGLQAERAEDFTPLFFLCQAYRLLASMTTGPERIAALRQSAAAWRSWPETSFTRREEQQDLDATGR